MVHARWFKATALAAIMTLVVGVSALGAQEPQEIPSVVGHWEGAIIVPGGELGIDVDLAQGENGAWTGDISIPVQATEDFPLSEVKVEGAQVTFAMAGVPGEPTFRGTLSEDGQTITGSFIQGGQSMQFRLTRTPA